MLGSLRKLGRHMVATQGSLPGHRLGCECPNWADLKAPTMPHGWILPAKRGGSDPNMGSGNPGSKEATLAARKQNSAAAKGGCKGAHTQRPGAT